MAPAPAGKTVQAGTAAVRRAPTAQAKAGALLQVGGIGRMVLAAYYASGFIARVLAAGVRVEGAPAIEPVKKGMVW